MAGERGPFRIPFHPETNIIPPRERGGMVLSVITPTRPDITRTPTLPREAPPPPNRPPLAQVLEKAIFDESRRITEKPKKTGNKMLVKVGSFVAAGLAIAGGVWGVKHLFEDNTSSANSQTRSIDSFDNIFNNKEGPVLVETKQVNPEEVFDPTATSGVIKPSMIEHLRQEEIDRLFPIAFGKLSEDNKTIIPIRQPVPESERAKHPDANIPDLLFEVGNDKNTLQLQYPLDLHLSSSPNAEISFKRSYSGFTATDRLASFQDKGYYDTLVFQDVPKGTIIQAPVDGFLTISRTDGNTYHNNPDESAGGFIAFQAPNGNIYRLSVNGSKGNDIFVLRPLLSAPDFASERNRMPIGTYGIPIKKGQALFQTDTKLDAVGFKILVAIKGKVGESPKIITSPFVPTNLELFTSHDNKVLASKK